MSGAGLIPGWRHSPPIPLTNAPVNPGAFASPRKERSIENQHLTPILITGGATLTALLLLKQASAKPCPAPPPSPFNQENLTERFVSAIPELTGELNLELATATFHETFTQTDSLSTFWGLLDLGTSTVQVQVPVTYRYHLCLREPWKLELHHRRLIVHAPVVKPSLPPAIHTDKLTTLTVRGWARGSTSDLLAALQQSITPTLNHYAGDHRHRELVRPRCRASVAEFVQLWLEREGHRFPEITVIFADENQIPNQRKIP